MNNIYIFWTDDNKISENRVNSINQLKQVTECNIVFIDKNNLNKYILEEHPLHEAYKYLSAVHKSDYLRTYFINFYGEGYCDIKKTTGSWKQSFNDLYNSDAWINGYKEIPGGSPVGINHNYLVGNGAYICKKNTRLTNEWYNNMISLLDKKLEDLKKNPANNPRDSFNDKGSKYPIAWAEMLGCIFHPLIFKYKEKVLKTLPILIFNNYV
jgi:hypothetical protein